MPCLVYLGGSSIWKSSGGGGFGGGGSYGGTCQWGFNISFSVLISGLIIMPFYVGGGGWKPSGGGFGGSGGFGGT